MFTVRAKIYGVLYKQSSSIAFDETSSYWSALKRSWFLGFSLVATRLSDYHWSAFRNHEGSTFTEKDRNKLNYRIGPKQSYSPAIAAMHGPHSLCSYARPAQPRLYGPCIVANAGFSGVVSHPTDLRVSQYVVSVESLSLIYHRPYS